MAGERRLNWGADATDAKWRTEHDTTNSKFIIAEDLDGATVLLEYDETNSQFEYRGPVEMNSNDISGVGTMTASAVSTGSLVIGGTLYEEDDNSPHSPSSTSSYTATIAGSYDEIIIVPQRDNGGYDQLRVNGKSDNNYGVIDNSDSQTSGASEWSIPTGDITVRYHLTHWKNSDRVGLNVEPARLDTGLTVFGSYRGDAITSIDSVTFLDSGGGNKSMNFRVFGRVMNI